MPPSTSSEPAAHARPPLVRPARGRVLAGVASGLATHLGVDLTVVRIAFVVLALSGGAGVLAYGFLWAFVPEGPEDVAAEPAGGGSTTRTRAAWLVAAGAALLVAGTTFLAGTTPDASFWGPLFVVGAGAVFAWAQLDEATRRRWMPDDPGRRGVVIAWVATGVAVAAVGLVLLATRELGLVELWDVVVAVLVVLLGVGVIVAPFATRLWRDLRTEQTERIRATERADIAAHLHDSVLQTLALIQRRSDDPQVVRLARGQERELRRWLFGGPLGERPTLASSVAGVAHEVEDRYGVPIDLVVTGDHEIGERETALVAALREALVNASRHGAPPIAAYVEVGPGRVEAFVRDHGPGFELEDAVTDRLGVRESILGRMHRHGGSARVSRLDDGTEVSLSLPLDGAPEEVGTRDEH